MGNGVVPAGCARIHSGFLIVYKSFFGNVKCLFSTYNRLPSATLCRLILSEVDDFQFNRAIPNKIRITVEIKSLIPSANRIKKLEIFVSLTHPRHASCEASEETILFFNPYRYRYYSNTLLTQIMAA